jgi:orotidine-5'-phosphate decarboxylase
MLNFTDKLRAAQAQTGSRLCIGLDPDMSKMPPKFRFITGLVDFNCAIIDATHDLACGYKLNWAFYEQYGIDGLRALERTLEHLHKTAPHLVTIADAKRGDIGNTSNAYAKAVFEAFACDAVTVAPYMGRDSVQPFLDYADKYTFVLALTSNQGSQDFQRLPLADGSPLYQHVIRTALTWTQHENVGFVVGATHPDDLATARMLAPTAAMLIPGVGAQGGDVAATLAANGDGMAIINASRAVLYASSGTDFAERAREVAMSLQKNLVLSESDLP